MIKDIVKNNTTQEQRDKADEIGAKAIVYPFTVLFVIANGLGAIGVIAALFDMFTSTR